MTKDEFLKKLRRELNSLDKEEVDSLIEEYLGYIDEKISSGISEKEAVASFGDVHLLALLLINSTKKDKERQSKDIISNFSEKIIKYSNDFLNLISTKNTGELLKIALEIIVVIFLISLCHIPVSLLEELGKSVFYILSSPLNQIFYTIWKVILEAFYLVVSLIIFAKIIYQRYLKDEVDEKISVNKDKNKIKSNKKEEVVTLHKNGIGGNIAKILVIFLKFLAILVLFIISCYLIGMGIILGLCIYLVIRGVTYFGIYLVMIALFLIGVFFFQLLFNFVLDRKIASIKTIFLLVFCLIILVSGTLLATFEVSETSFINKVPDNLSMETLSEEIPYSSDLILVGNISNYIVDDSLDKIIVLYNYYPIGTKMSTKITKVRNEVHLNWDVNEIKISKELIEQMINDLATKKIYNYNIEPEIIIKANANQINRLKKNRQVFYHEISNYSTCEFIKTYEVVNVIKAKNSEFTYITLKSFNDDEVYTAKVSDNLVSNIKSGETYEFTFKTYQSYIDRDIEEIFNNATLIKVVKTDKIGEEQIDDTSCRVFY